MNRTHEQVIDAQFGPRAQAYVESAVHARGPDLEALREVVSAVRPARALDLGTGGGHVAYMMAHYAGAVTASDLSREMLAAVAAAAKDRELGNVEVAETSAERLTFVNEWFDFLGSRYSAHHWRNFEAGLREARRVLKHGSKAVFIDAFAPEAAALDTTCRRSNCSATLRMFGITQARNGSPRSTARALRCRLSDRGGFAWIFQPGLPGCKRRRITSALSGRCKWQRPAKSATISRSKRTAPSCWMSR